MYRVTKTTNMYRSCEDGTPRSAGREIQKGTLVELLYTDGDCARIQLPDGSRVFFPRSCLEVVEETPPEEPPVTTPTTLARTFPIIMPDGSTLRNRDDIIWE